MFLCEYRQVSFHSLTVVNFMLLLQVLLYLFMLYQKFWNASDKIVVLTVRLQEKE